MENDTILKKLKVYLEPKNSNKMHFQIMEFTIF